MMKAKTSVLLAMSALLLTAICWGLAPVATRYLLQSLSPIAFLLIRFILASLLFLPFIFRRTKEGWSRRYLLLAVAGGLVGTIGYYAAVTFGLQWISAGTAGLLLATEPLWIALFSLLLLHDRLRLSILCGLVLALLGVALLVGGTLLSPMLHITTVIGMGLTLFSAIMWGLYTIIVRPISQRYGAFTCTAITTIIGTIPLLTLWPPDLLSVGLHLDLAGWIALVLLTVGSTIIATILWNYGVARLPGAQAGAFLYLVPLFSVLGGAIFLHEPVTLDLLISGLLIIGGVIVTQLPSIWQQSHHAIDKSKVQPTTVTD